MKKRVLRNFTKFTGKTPVPESFLIKLQASKNIFFTKHLWTTSSGVEVFLKRGVLKNFVNFTVKRLWWILFLIKLQAWHLFSRTSANYCFCTALASLAVPYQFYFIFSSFFLIIIATTFNVSDVFF